MPATFLKPSPLLRQWGRGAFWDNKVETLGCAVNCQKGQNNPPTYLVYSVILYIISSSSNGNDDDPLLHHDKCWWTRGSSGDPERRQRFPHFLLASNRPHWVTHFNHHHKHTLEKSWQSSAIVWEMHVSAMSWINATSKTFAQEWKVWGRTWPRLEQL